ncbi:Rieske 2Fe-2S domain-containing protein [Lysobacter sp. Hz 25]
MLYRAGGTVVSAADHCPHRGMRPSLGQCRDGALICPCRGPKFGDEKR